MNWLAHLVLSDSDAAFRVGNVLADILPITELRALPESFQAGIVRHRAIDSFTDRHPTFKQSIARLDPRFRRYGGVIMDIFYDHFLTTQWRDHSDIDIETFVAQFHTDVELCRLEIPTTGYAVMQRMRTGEWLTSYRDVAGVRLTLKRIGTRLRRPFDLGGAAAELQTHHDALAQDFNEFFPQIRAHFSS